MTPRALHKMKPLVRNQERQTRHPRLITFPELPVPSLMFRRSPIQLATSLLNHIGSDYYNASSMIKFKTKLAAQRHHLLDNFRIG